MTTLDRPAVRINRDAPLPYYHQLKQILLREIGTVWHDGDLLPSEGELCARFGVSRPVVRRSLDELERDGRVYKIKGKGTFVTQPKLEAAHIQQVAGFFAVMRDAGHKVTSQVLRQEVAPAAAQVAKMLAVRVGEPVIAIDRVRSVDDVPISVVRAWISQTLCPGLEHVDLREASMYETIGKSYGLRPHHGNRTIEAVGISTEDAAFLGVRPGAPALLVESVVRTEDDIVLEYFIAVYRGDRSRLDIRLVHE